jgi:6-phosphogluconolactonase (cycloisomerase 2 family)
MSIRKLYLSSIDTSTATAGDVLVYSLANGEIEFGTVETSAGNNIISPNSQYSLTIQDTGESILNSNLVPSTNNTLSLGSPDAVWKDLYVGPGTIYVGDVQLSSVDGGLSITSTTSNTSTILDTSSSNLSATINLVQSNLSALPDSAANDYATYTSIVGLINTVQDNIVSSSGSFSNIVSDQFTVSSSNIFTLSQSVADANNIIVSYNGIIQSPNDDYVVSGTTLSISNTTPLFSGVDIEVRHLTASGGATVTVGSTLPAVPAAGELFLLTTTNALYVSTGAVWTLVSNSAPVPTGGTVTIGALVEGSTFSYNLGIDFEDAVDPDGSLVYTLFSGTMPPGCTLPTAGNSAFTGTVGGVSSNTNYTWVITATDTSGGTANQNYQQTITNVVPTSWGGTVSIAAVAEGQSASYNVNSNFTFATAAVFSAYSLQSGSLPSGLSLNTSTGVISGTMGAVSSTTPYSFTIRATDTDGDTVDQSYTWTITNVVPTSTGGTVTIAAVNEGLSASYDVDTNFTFATGSIFSAYSLQSGTLPSGLSLNTSTGIISGTMGTVASTTAYSFTIRATDTDGDTVNQSYTWTITNVPLSWSYPLLAVGHINSPYVTIYDQDIDTFTKLDNPATLPNNNAANGYALGIAFSNDDTYLAVAHGGTPFITIYKRSEGVYTKLPNPAILPASACWDVAFSSDATYMAVVHGITPFIIIYKRSGDVFTKLADPATLPTGVSRGIAFSNDDTYLAVGHSTQPCITIYKRSGDVFTKLANPATLPVNSIFSVKFSSDATYLVCAGTGGPYIIIYKRSGDVFTKLANPATLPAGNCRGVAFSSDDTYVAVSCLGAPYIFIYKRSGDVFTKLANPATLPTGMGYGIDFSSDVLYLAVSHATSPYITIYKRSGDVFTKLANPATLPTGSPNNDGNSLAFSNTGFPQ